MKYQFFVNIIVFCAFTFTATVIPKSSEAGFFTYDNYEECVSKEAGSSSTETSYVAAIEMCKKKFPKFPKLYASKTSVVLSCEPSGLYSGIELPASSWRIEGNNINSYVISFRTKEKIVADKKDFRVVLDTIEGTLKAIWIPKNRSATLECFEN